MLKRRQEVPWGHRVGSGKKDCVETFWMKENKIVSTSLKSLRFTVSPCQALKNNQEQLGPTRPSLCPSSPESRFQSKSKYSGKLEPLLRHFLSTRTEEKSKKEYERSESNSSSAFPTFLLSPSFFSRAPTSKAANVLSTCRLRSKSKKTAF